MGREYYTVQRSRLFCDRCWGHPAHPVKSIPPMDLCNECLRADQKKRDEKKKHFPGGVCAGS